MLKKKPHRLILWYFWANLAILHTFFIWTKKVKLDIWVWSDRIWNFIKIRWKSKKLEWKVCRIICIVQDLLTCAMHVCICSFPPLPWSSHTFNMFLKYCIFRNTLLAYNLGFMRWIGMGNNDWSLGRKIFHKVIV